MYSLAALYTEAPSLFGNISSDAKPIAVKSRRYSKPDQLFIRDEIDHLLREGIIEPSCSPRRAQVLVIPQMKITKREWLSTIL